MKRLLDEFVERELFAGKEPPSKKRRRYYPNMKDIRNYMSKGKMLTRLTGNVRDDLVSLAKRLQKTHPTEYIILQSEYPGKDTSQIKLVDHMCYKPTLIFCHQTQQQQRLMKRYGSQVNLCEVTNHIDRSPFPLFCLFVQTNVDYQPVATFILEYRNLPSHIQGLKTVKEWNPGWSPKYFITESSAEQTEAVTQVFAGTVIDYFVGWKD